MYHQSLSEDTLDSLEVAPQAIAASTTVNGTGVDMQGWDGVQFYISKGAGDKTLDAKAQGDTASGFGTAADITSATITQIATGTTNTMSILDVWRPTKRYIRCVVVTGSGGSTSDQVTVTAKRYRRTGLVPVTLDTTVGELKKFQQN